MTRRPRRAGTASYVMYYVCMSCISSFLSNLVTESSTNPRTLWKTLNTILHRNPSNSFPESPDASSLANTQINNLHIFTIVFYSRHILFLHDLLICLFFPFHMSDHHLAKGLSLSSVHASGIHSPLIPETHLLYQYSVPDSKHTSSKLRSLPRLFPISLDCLPGF